MSDSALAKLNQDGWTLKSLPDVENTELWDFVKTRFGLANDELKSLVDAKKAVEHAKQTPVKVTLKYSNREIVEVSNLLRGEATVDFLKSEATRSWKELDTFEFELHAGKNQVISDDFLQKCAFPLALTVNVDQLGFGDFMSASKALEYAGVSKLALGDANNLSFPQKLPIGDSDPVFLHACKDLRLRHALYDPLEDGCEYTRREFISPILVLAATKAGVKLACEEMVEGSRAKGPVDWMAHYEDHGICITEGKKDNITAGLYQNLAQLTALGEKRGTKRAYEVEIPLYGVATTYREWIFTRLSPPGETRDAVRLPTMGILQGNDDSVKNVAECLAGILQSQKLLVDAATGPPTNKPSV